MKTNKINYSSIKEYVLDTANVLKEIENVLRKKSNLRIQIGDYVVCLVRNGSYIKANQSTYALISNGRGIDYGWNANALFFAVEKQFKERA